MRWGVRDESTDDHSTLELCLKELKACQDLSTGPNFVVNKLNYFSLSGAVDQGAPFCLALDSPISFGEGKLLDNQKTILVLQRLLQCLGPNKITSSTNDAHYLSLTHSGNAVLFYQVFASFSPIGTFLTNSLQTTHSQVKL